jgi:trehalose/maltose hydrolase-like predicted phosphorylase
MRISRRSLMSGTALALAGHRFAPDGWSAPAAGIPVMARTDFSQQIDPAYLSNGLIGIRPGPNPLAAAATAVSGYVYAHPVHRVECLSPAPYPLATDVVIGDASFLKQPERVTTRRQTLDMATGELLTEMDFEPKPGMRIAISVLQFACRSTPALLCQEITIASDTPVSLKLLPQIVTQYIPGQTMSRALPQRPTPCC